ncbi:ACT domain-containing protein [uncultured Shewanella sp.]|uniref:ACT domain-containing protein n=1 Tax=Shewanella atlantica TaxID=271099 RepID=UPI00261D26EE|nr:ACT domain-containing protein [uncultured Shewanella sp.]
MNKLFITTVIGPITPGIIKSLAEVTRAFKGEWLTSKVIKLDGHFSAMMKVAIAPEAEAELKAELVAKFAALQFVFDDVIAEPAAASRALHLTLDCGDRAGLTRDIVNILTNLDLVIEHMEFNRVHVSPIGQTVFSSNLNIAVPEGVSTESVVELLEGVSEDARVNIL